MVMTVAVVLGCLLALGLMPLALLMTGSKRLHTWHLWLPFTQGCGIGGADRASARARLRRRSYPIRAVVGPNGAGKSTIAAYDLIPSLDLGRPVLSTVRLLDYRDPHLCGERPNDVCDDPENHEVERLSVDLRHADPDDPTSPIIRTTVPTGIFDVHRAAHPGYVRFEDYTQLIGWRDGDIFMDEVTGVASSRDSQTGMPTQVANLLVQLRRRNCTLTWTSPSWARADKIIREVTQAVTLMEGAWAVKAPPAPDGSPRLWSQKRLFKARTYDALLFEDFTAKRAVDIDPDINAWYWAPGGQMFEVFDTYAPVSALGWANAAGLCIHCGGKRAVPKCGCPEGPEIMAPAPRGYQLPPADDLELPEDCCPPAPEPISLELLEPARSW